MFAVTIHKPSSLALNMITGFYLDNFMYTLTQSRNGNWHSLAISENGAYWTPMYCNQCWPMDCNCRLIA